MYAIAGVNGNTGSVVAAELLARGEGVRVIVRDAATGAAWAHKGVEVAVADLSDAAALAAAFAGADGAYVLLPPQYQAEDLRAVQAQMRDAVVQATVQSHLPHVVLLSSVGAQHAAGTGPIRSLHDAEQAFRAAGSNATFVRAAYFMENWAPVLPEAASSGKLMTFLEAGKPVDMVATRDIGRVAAQALVDPVKGVRVIELSGPAPYTPEEVAAELAGVLGRPVSAVVGPLEYAVPTLTQMGFTAGTAELFREMLAGINSGHVAFEGGSAVRQHGTLTPGEVFRTVLAATAA